MARGTRGALLLVAALSAAGCSVPVAGALDEAHASAVVVALERAGIAADKEPDPTSEAHFRVNVDRDEAARALAVLREEELPSRASPGVLDALGKGSIVPSALSERAQWIAGLSGELERTLGGVDGVLSARVHLSLPSDDPLDDGPRTKATASVLLKHRGATPPLDPNEVRRLVAGAAPGLAPDDVAVVLVARPAPPAAPDHGLARIGPIAATRGSVGWLRIGVAVAVATNLALVVAVLALWAKLRRARGEDDA